MNLPNYLSALILSIMFWPDSRAQSTQPCMEIKVEMKIQSGDGISPESKVVLEFESADYQDFRLFLFSGDQSDNRLDLEATEINNLSKGNYTLIIQHSDKEENFCPKQFNFKIN